MGVWHIWITTLTFLISLSVSTSLALANAFEPPPERNAPHSTAGGGSRPATDSSCTLAESSGLRATAMAPKTFVGLTKQANPNLWLYLPTNEAKSIELSIFDQQLNGLSQFEIASPTAPGFVAVDLSEHIALSVGTPYYWTAAFVCNPNRRTEDWVVGGWIQYQSVSTSEQQTLQELPPLEQVQRYMSTGYWYDAFTMLLPLVRANPSAADVEATWNTLMRQAALELTRNNLGNVVHISK